MHRGTLGSSAERYALDVPAWQGKAASWWWLDPQSHRWAVNINNARSAQEAVLQE